MTYKEYKGYTKAYIVVHNTGFGVMEAPYKEKEVVYETDSLKEAEKVSRKFEKKNNSKKDIKSTWIPNTYWINVNTLSPKGKLLEKEFDSKCNDKIDYAKLTPDLYEKVEKYGITFYMMKGFATPQPTKIDFKDSGFIIPLNTK